jgi:hypothetical protein
MAVYGKPALIVLAVAILFTTVLPCLPNTTAQTDINTVFSSNDTFNAPGFNSTIRFAVNGSYTTVTLSDGNWTFTGLRLGYSRNTANVSIGAKDCDLTIYSVSASNFSARSVSLRYNDVGGGSQTVRFVDIKQSTTSVEWSVIVPGNSGSGMVWLSEGRNWDLKTSNTVVVHDVTGNVTISRYNLGSFSNVGRNEPFNVAHSIALITLGALAAVVAVALVVKLVRKP